MNVHELIAAQRVTGEAWQEFLRVPALSVGLYVLEAGGVDAQTPHTEAEVYVVLEGRGSLSVDGVDQAATPGDVLFVAAHADHRFHTITDTLRLLVVFAPAEGTTGAALP